MRGSRHERGFTMLEALVASTLTALLLGILLTAVDSSRRLAQDQAEWLEMEMNLRAAVEFMSRDLLVAGYGLQNDRYASTLGVIYPNSDSSSTWTNNALTVWHNLGDVKGTLLATMAQATSDVSLDTVTGFAVGDRVLIVGPGSDGLVHNEWFTVTGVVDGAGAAEKHLEHHQAAAPTLPTSFTTRYQKGAVVLRVTDVTYRMGTDSEGRSVLLRRERGGTDQPVAENITALSFGYFDGATSPAALLAIDTAAERCLIRKVHVDVTAKTEKRSRVTRKQREYTWSADVSPRNLVPR